MFSLRITWNNVVTSHPGIRVVKEMGYAFVEELGRVDASLGTVSN